MNADVGLAAQQCPWGLELNSPFLATGFFLILMLVASWSQDGCFSSTYHVMFEVETKRKGRR